MSTTATPRTPVADARTGSSSPGIDPRGPQVAAALTAVVLVAVLLLPSPADVTAASSLPCVPFTASR